MFFIRGRYAGDTFVSPAHQYRFADLLLMCIHFPMGVPYGTRHPLLPVTGKQVIHGFLRLYGFLLFSLSFGVLRACKKWHQADY